MATKDVISTDRAPGPFQGAPYNQAIRVGDLVFVAGQLGISRESGELVGPGVGEQTEQIMENLGAILEAAGASFDNVVRTTVYLADMSDFAKVNEVYGTYFSSPAPARATVQAARLPKDARVEIDLIATV